MVLTLYAVLAALCMILCKLLQRVSAIWSVLWEKLLLVFCSGYDKAYRLYGTQQVHAAMTLPSEQPLLCRCRLRQGP